MSLRDPSIKMSKSDPHQLSRIMLTDSAETITLKIRKSETDSIAGVSYDPTTRPGVSNLVEIYAHMQRKTDFVAVAKELEGCSMKELKVRVAECVVEGLAPFRKEYARIMNEGEEFLEQVAFEGGCRARENAEETMVLVRKAMGLV